MHTSKFTVPPFGEVYVSHHADWSGLARFSLAGVYYELPGRLLLAIGRQAAGEFIRSALISTLEQLDIPNEAPAPSEGFAFLVMPGPERILAVKAVREQVPELRGLKDAKDRVDALPKNPIPLGFRFAEQVQALRASGCVVEIRPMPAACPECGGGVDHMRTTCQLCDTPLVSF